MNRACECSTVESCFINSSTSQAAALIGAASTIHMTTRIGTHLSSRIGIGPEIIEVEPVVRRQATVILQALRVAQRTRANQRTALATLDLRHFREALEVEVVTVAAAVDRDHQDHGPPGQRRDAKRRRRQRGGRSEKRDAHRSRIVKAAIAEHANPLPSLYPVLHLHHRIDRPHADHGAVQARIDRLGERVYVPAAVLEHHHADVEVVLFTEHMQRLEATEMRADQEAGLAARVRLLEDIPAMHVHVELRETIAQQEHPVQRHRREAVVVAKKIGRRRRAIEHPLQILARGRAPLDREQEEIGAHRIEQ